VIDVALLSVIRRWHLRDGMPIHVLQELGGWSDIRMVQRYTHLAPEHLACYADNISGLKGVNGTLLAKPGKITA
jgi:beta-glucosidase/6-phospho-beta-glucosidase/beta-galactosidase